MIFVQMYGNKTLAEQWKAKKNQTIDLTLSNLNVKQLANGDYVYVLTATDFK